MRASRPQVPCVAVVENMSYFEADGKRYSPFGQGSGERRGATSAKPAGTRPVAVALALPCRMPCAHPPARQHGQLGLLRPARACIAR